MMWQTSSIGKYFFSSSPLDVKDKVFNIKRTRHLVLVKCLLWYSFEQVYEKIQKQLGYTLKVNTFI